MTQYQLVNIVARGHLGREIDLSALEEDIDAYEVYIEGPGLYFKITEDSPTVTLARSGKYIITGCTSRDELDSEHSRTLDYLTSINLLERPEDKSFEIVNVVATYELDSNLDLNTLVVYLGMEQTEYEPEQFPGIVFRPEDLDIVFLLFTSGKVVITGVDSIKKSRQSTSFLDDLLKEYLESVQL
ncbi:TATA-box-binding protein C [Haloarcula sp. Atlit-47R]|uniref:TATA-box-binding protein C n=1 Tax=Haloarcula sp. Atlit-47R TaxID=2282132 RepID=UPI000EF25114|nr:TATA-box-binding protein C [Haloarcula sp. Atlit-47R]RLM47413.1 TATA-box-binding protein C [Haloarcula sp. Atlit-47R]